MTLKCICLEKSCEKFKGLSCIKLSKLKWQKHAVSRDKPISVDGHRLIDLFRVRLGVIFLSEVIRTAQFHAFVPEIGVWYHCNSKIKHPRSYTSSRLYDVSLALRWCINKQNHVIANAHIIQHIDPQQKQCYSISQREF
jgi:hypothetical protein